MTICLSIIRIRKEIGFFNDQESSPSALANDHLAIRAFVSIAPSPLTDAAGSRRLCGGFGGVDTSTEPDH